MAIVLDILTWSFKKRLKLVVTGTLIYFILLIVFGLKSLGTVPTTLLMVMVILIMFSQILV